MRGEVGSGRVFLGGDEMEDFFSFLGGNEILGIGKSGVRHMGEMGFHSPNTFHHLRQESAYEAPRDERLQVVLFRVERSGDDERRSRRSEARGVATRPVGHRLEEHAQPAVDWLAVRVARVRGELQRA